MLTRGLNRPRHRLGTVSDEPPDPCPSTPHQERVSTIEPVHSRRDAGTTAQTENCRSADHR